MFIDRSMVCGNLIDFMFVNRRRVLIVRVNGIRNEVFVF